MKFKYIVFYAIANGYGSTDVKVSRKEKPSSVEKLREIEEALADKLKTPVTITNFILVGRTWK